MKPRYEFNPKLRKRVEIINGLVSLVIILVCALSIIGYTFYEEKITDQVKTYGYFGLSLSTFILELVPQFLNPFLVIAAGLSSGLSLTISLFFVIIGSLLGSILGFELGKKYGWNFVSPILNEKEYNKLVSFWDKYGRLFVFVSAISPIPYVPLFFGALDMKRTDFWIYGIIPRILGFIAMGYAYYFGIVQYTL